MRNARLHESQVAIKIAERNVSNIRQADDTSLMVDREELREEPLEEGEREK